MTKILLVEDDKLLRQMYGERLLAEGFDIVSASDGEEAISMAINELPDLIISDIMMPKISGFEMLDLLKTNARTSDIKVIVMTALGGDAQKQHSERLGADRYLVKSQVGIEDVVATVHEVLASKNTAAGASAQPSIPNVVAPAQNPAMQPAPNQSSFNPPRATSPSDLGSGSSVTLPDAPLAVPTIMNSTASSAPASPAASAPIAPQPQQTAENATENGEPNQTTTASGMRVIRPTGESLSNQVNLDTLIIEEDVNNILSNQPANEVTPTMPEPSAPVNDSQPVANTEVPSQPEPSDEQVQVDSNGTVNIDSLPEPDSNSGLFPVS